MGKAKQRRAPKDKRPSRGEGAGAGANGAAYAAAVAAGERDDGGGRATGYPDPNRDDDPSVVSLLLYLLRVLFMTALSLPFWVVVAALSLIYGLPPKTVRPGQAWRYLRLCTVERNRGPSARARLDLAMTIIANVATSAVSACCWLLDEVLYGSTLDSAMVDVRHPLFVVSAYRSASTQMARALAQDAERFAAPSAIMCAFPYLWMWKLVTYIFGEDCSGMTVEEMNGYLNKKFTRESLERHDNNHFAIDTFDGYFLASHLNGLAFRMGPDAIAMELNSAKFEERDRRLFETLFVEHVDRIARKTLLFRGAPRGRRTFLLKGHFLSSAPALQRKYPDARFLAILRDPLDRLQSAINHAAVNATLWQGTSPRWDWLSESFPLIEAEYCRREMEWYSRDDDDDDNVGCGVRLCLAVKFDAFIKDFEGTMKKIYVELLREEELLPDFVSPSKVSRRYSVDRSLNELGVDEAEFKQQLAGYYEWMKKR